jgi:hypothetical protein
MYVTDERKRISRRYRQKTSKIAPDFLSSAGAHEQRRSAAYTDVRKRDCASSKPGMGKKDKQEEGGA